MRKRRTTKRTERSKNKRESECEEAILSTQTRQYIIQRIIHANNIIMHAFINNTFYSLTF